MCCCVLVVVDVGSGMAMIVCRGAAVVYKCVCVLFTIMILVVCLL